VAECSEVFARSASDIDELQRASPEYSFGTNSGKKIPTDIDFRKATGRQSAARPAADQAGYRRAARVNARLTQLTLSWRPRSQVVLPFPSRPGALVKE